MGTYTRKTTVEDRIRWAVQEIRERYREPLCLDDLARAATMSKFYFLRVFRNYTGVTPGRYLSAVRIHEAKRMLLSTTLNVATICNDVGYGSLGAFTRRFTECVGLPPKKYRCVIRGGADHPANRRPPLANDRNLGTVFGSVTTTRPASSPVFVGLYPGPTPRGLSVAWTSVYEAGPWRITAVPSGVWHVRVAAESLDGDLTASCAAQGPAGRPLLTGLTSDVSVAPGGRVQLNVTATPTDWTQPPLLVVLPGVESV